MADNKEQAMRKQVLVDHALDLFSKHGYDNTTVSEIAKASGVAKGLVYYYFASKEEILESVAEYVCSRHIERLTRKMEAQDLDFFGRLLLLMEAYYDIHPYTKSGSSLLWSQNTVFADVFHQIYLRRIDNLLSSIVKQGESEGYLNIKYPKLMIIMTLEGIFGLGRYQAVKRSEVLELIEQSLNLPQHSLGKQGNVLLTHFENQGGDSFER